jgi:hypothetical protein
MTRNLQSALCDLHSSSISPKIFFVDQICIDQNDNNEKSVQVAKMGDVYYYADQVVTYLGPGESGDDDALDLLDRIGRQFGRWFDNLDDDNDLDMLDRFVRRREVPDHLKEFKLDYSGKRSLAHLESIVYDGGWTNRLWMLQENLRNSDVIFLRGTRTVSRRLVHMLPFCQSFGLVPKPESISSTTFRHALMVADAYRDFHRKSRSPSFIKLINDFGTTMGCANPRDKIYAVMGLVEEKWGVEPDYDSDVLDVYTDFAIKSIEETKTLDIFNSIDDSHSKHSTSKRFWPSWVPTFEENALLTIRGNASRTTVPIIKHDGLHLKVKGYEIDRIAERIVTFRPGAFVHGSISRDNLRDIVTKLRKAKECLRRNGVENASEALCYAVLGSHESPDPQHSGYFHGYAWRSFETAMDLLQSALDRGDDPCDFSTRERQYETHEQIANDIISSLNIADRSLCLTKGNKVMLTTKNATAGDAVVVLLGGGPVYVIREAKCWDIIGPAYMHGVMKGETIHDRDWEEKTAWVFHQILDRSYIDLANCPIYSWEPDSRADKIRETNKDLQRMARQMLTTILGILISSRDKVMQNSFLGSADYEKECRRIVDDVSTFRNGVVYDAVLEGPFKRSTNASWRSDWWGFIDHLLSRDVIPEPKWRKNLKEYDFW